LFFLNFLNAEVCHTANTFLIEEYKLDGTPAHGNQGGFENCHGFLINKGYINGYGCEYWGYKVYPICYVEQCHCEDGDGNKTFPDLNQTIQEVAFTWNRPEDRTNECTTDRNGTVEEQILDCNSTFRCVVNKVQECTEPDFDFPHKALNEQITSTWSMDNNNTQSCLDTNGVVQEKKKDCNAIFRCVTKTDSCPTVPVEPINSYVNPQDRAFHEDIELDGIGFGLHYKSTELNATQTLAKGWSLSNHHFYVEGKLYRGDGTTLVATASFTEGENIVINSAGQEFVFDASLRHIETRDAYSKKRLYTFTYENNKLVTVANEFGLSTSLEYDAEGTLTTITAPHGQITALSIDVNGDLLEVQYEDGSSYAFEYENHLMTKESEPNGNIFLHIFDSEGKISKVIDAEQGEWSFNNDTTSFGTKTVLRASGDSVRYKNYAVENGMLKFETILASGEVITTLKAVDDSQESQTSCGMTTTKKYKMVNGVLERDPINHKRVLESTSTITPSGLVRRVLTNKAFKLDANGSLESFTLNSTLNGKITTSVRDYLNHIATQTTAMGKVSQVQYTTDDSLVLWSQPYGLNKTTYSYDNEGRVTKQTEGNRTTLYSYDARGNLASSTDAKGRVTTYAYDSRDRLVKTTYPNGNTIQNSYDKNGNMTVFTTPTPSEHTFTYNGVNKRVSMISPLHATTSYEYDKARRVTKVIRPSGKIVLNNYSNEKLSSTVTAEGTTNYSYACQGNLASKTKGSESLTYEYDGTLLTKVTQSGQLNQTLKMSYNSDFLFNSLSYAGATTNYSYNKDNEVVKVGSYDIVRTKQNRKVKVSDGTYKQVKRFNKYGELTKLKDKRTLVKLSYNKNGQIVKKVEKINRKKVVYRYSYDKQGRLTKVKRGNRVVERYTYDKNGNRKSAKVYGKRITASYTLDDQLEVYGNNTYRYDDGYLVEKTTPDGTTTYEYGTLGELKRVVTPTKAIEYLHNANNQRVSKLINGQVEEKYLWANLTTLLAIYDANNNLKQRFEYANNRMPISMTQNGQKYYLHYDQVGTLKAISNSKQRIIKKITYDTYGNILFESNKKFSVPFGFAGGLYDHDTKLTQFGYRDYDAYTGKWTAKDPIDFGGGDSNLYGYVLGDPVDFVDPSGLVLVVDDAVVVAGLAAVAIYVAADYAADLLIAVGRDAYDWWRYSEADDNCDNGFNPKEGKKKKHPKTGEPGWEDKDGGLWSKDRAGGNSHGGSAWKRWKNRRDWERGRPREGTYDENGNRLRD